jgi:hypothetical protein
MNRTLILIGLLSSAFFAALAPCAVANTAWYVDGTNGSDTNNCMSASTACKTIGHAISLAGSGDSILISAYYYPEHLTIAVSLSLIGSGQGTKIDGQSNDVVVNVSDATANVTLANLTVQHGRGGFGGGIVNHGELTLNNTIVTGNTAEFFGGGVYNYGTIQVINSTLSGNSVFNTCSYPLCRAAGGAIYNQGAAVISNSTLSENHVLRVCGIPRNVCQASGGAVSSGGGTLIITNSTLAYNSAQNNCNGNFCEAYGGGIWAGGSVTISNSTLRFNSVSASTTAGDNIYVYVSGTATFQNSIVAGTCSGTIISKGYNLSADGSCNFTSAGDRNNTDPLLGPLQNNGGPTATMALSSGSPAIDAGNPAGCVDAQGHLLTTDQRGMPRPDKEDSVGCDMGAYESQSD